MNNRPTSPFEDYLDVLEQIKIRMKGNSQSTALLQTEAFTQLQKLS